MKIDQGVLSAEFLAPHRFIRQSVFVGPQKNVNISVDITLGKITAGYAYGGVSCREDPGYFNYYKFIVFSAKTGTGKYVVGYEVDRAVQGNVSTLQTDSLSMSDSPSQTTMKMQVICFGNSFLLIVNDESVPMIIDDTLKGGGGLEGVYVWAGSDRPGARVDFDNLVIKQLASAP